MIVLYGFKNLIKADAAYNIYHDSTLKNNPGFVRVHCIVILFDMVTSLF